MGRGNFAIDCGLGARQAALDNRCTVPVTAPTIPNNKKNGPFARSDFGIVGAVTGIVLQRLLARQAVQTRKVVRPIACSGCRRPAASSGERARFRDLPFSDCAENFVRQ